MIEPIKPPPEVDALARRLPRRTLSAERSLAMRDALLDAAELPAPSPIRGPARWWISVGAVAAAAAVVAMIAWRGGAAHAPSPVSVPVAAVAVTSIDAGVAIASGAVPLPTADVPAPARAPAPLAPPAPIMPLADGVHAIDVDRPVQLTRGDATITAPAGARFDVEVRDGRVQRIAVKAGWVVIAGAHDSSTMVAERQTWTLPVAPPPDPDPRPAPPPTPKPAPGRTAAVAPPPIDAPGAAPVVEAAPVVDAVPAPTSEQDFRDGLRALLAGAPDKAVDPLDRACRAPSTSQMDICYWSAVAWLRTGDQTRARQGFTDVLARWPGSTHGGEANVALGWLLLEAGDRAGGRARFAAAADDRVPGVRADAARGLAAAQ